MASNTNFKAPPSLSKCSSYEMWLKEIKIWQKFTDLKPSKQGPAIFLTLENRAREAVLELDVDVISSDGGVDDIVKKLDTLFLKDQSQLAYDAYDNFEKFKRPSSMSITEYINEFERLKSKTKNYGTEMSSDILAYRLLKSANISEQHEQLARATISELKYEGMKTQLKKIFGDSSKGFSSDNDLCNVKVESTYEATDEQDTYYQSSRNYRGSRFPQQQRAPFSYGQHRNVQQTSQKKNFRNNYVPKSSTERRGRNPLNDKGEVSRCTICDSLNHWMSNCPDSVYYQQNVTGEDVDDNNHHVTLYQSNMITEDQMNVFVSESFNSAILDSGATSTVAGKTWMECYVDGLSPTEKQGIKYSESANSFKFGSGTVFPSLYKVQVPATLGFKKVMIEADVVDSKIPMLLSRKSMKKANTKINFKEDTVTMFGEKQNVLITNSGHYGIPLNNKHEILNLASQSSAKITLHIESVNVEDKPKVAQKLHSQFAHPSANRLIKLVSAAGMGDDSELIREIREVAENCKICKEYKRPSPRPVVGMPLASSFNEVVAMDLKMFDGKWILHLIDHLSRFSAACFIKSKKPEEIIENIFKIWISVFGPPAKFLSDNGGEFMNSQFLELCESFNISVMTTAAEAPWSNGLCERHNAILGDMLQKTYAEGRCNLNTALCWVIHAKNSLANVHGFSPYQIAIGYTPNLPGVLNDRLPALESSTNRTILDNLNAIASARKAFIQTESCDRIRRALAHNVRRSSANKFFSGDLVYYKRNDSKKWKGPGKVIGQDSQQVLIKHGSAYVRVHPCRIMLEKKSHEKTRTGDSVSEVKPNGNGQPSEIEMNPIIGEGSSTYDNESSDNDSIKSDVAIGVMEEDESHQVDRTVNSENIPDHDAENQVNIPAVKRKSISSGQIPKIKKGMELEYIPEDCSEWTTASILSRAGKATGKYSGHWNVTDGIENREVNFDKVAWRVPPAGNDGTSVFSQANFSSDEINISDVFLSHIDEETSKAKSLELDSWKAENVYKEVDDRGQSTISVRWVVTPKLVDGAWITKARLVARGFEENSANIRTDSPTCMRETMKILLSVASSKQWDVNSIDIKTAFLQGKPIEREMFLKPPKEANCEGKIWQLNKVVYGLSDASRVWYLRVVEELSSLNVTTSKFDKALFLWKSKGELEGVLIVHVDDFLWCGTESFYQKVILKMRETFKISKENKSFFKYIGIDLNQKTDGIHIDQRSYINNIQPILLSDRSCPDKSETIKDSVLHKAFRGVVGQLNWACGVSRPDSSFNACNLSTVQAKPNYAHIFEANKAIRELKNTQYEIVYPRLDLSSVRIAAFSDASYANLTDGGSQGGFILFLYDKTSTCSPIAWASKKVKRITRSTLGAETLAAVDALDCAYLVSNILAEFLGEEKTREIDMFTDNKSLYDSMHTSNLVTDKRLRVDIFALREMQENGEVNFRWLNSSCQLADALTKKGASKQKLLDVLGTAHLDF